MQFSAIHRLCFFYAAGGRGDELPPPAASALDSAETNVHSPAAVAAADERVAHDDASGDDAVTAADTHGHGSERSADVELAVTGPLGSPPSPMLV